jgi:hypothetical protein
VGKKVILADGLIFRLTKTDQPVIVEANARRVGNVRPAGLERFR